jgi:GNAT superfamily N-acetyltransferase
LILRIATPDDAEAINVLLTVSYPVLLAEVYDPVTLAVALPRMTVAQPRLLASGTYYVVERTEGGLAGCGGWSHEAPGSATIEDGVAHLRHFATHPGCLRQGIGRSILARCAQAAGRQGVSRFCVFSTLSAEPFYASAGLRRVKLVDVSMGPGAMVPAVAMEGPVEAALAGSPG